MKRILLAVLLMLLMTNTVVASEKDPSRVGAEKFLTVVNMEQVLEETIEKLLAVELEKNPAIAPYKEVMKKFFSKYMSYQSLKEEFITMYAEAFTAKELQEITTFYSTATGKKAI